jgi:hypothetical protein
VTAGVGVKGVLRAYGPSSGLIALHSLEKK